jgi:hypothetical protein
MANVLSDSPVGPPNSTWLSQLRFVRVQGTTNAVSVIKAWKLEEEMTTPGRMPDCSRPTVEPKSTSITNPG